VPQPIVLAEGYPDTLKVLRHSMAALGATECRIIAARTLEARPTSLVSRLDPLAPFSSRDALGQMRCFSPRLLPLETIRN
jgi:hypothetical protein